MSIKGQEHLRVREAHGWESRAGVGITCPDGVGLQARSSPSSEVLLLISLCILPVVKYLPYLVGCCLLVSAGCHPFPLDCWQYDCLFCIVWYLFHVSWPNLLSVLLRALFPTTLWYDERISLSQPLMATAQTEPSRKGRRKRREVELCGVGSGTPESLE